VRCNRDSIFASGKLLRRLALASGLACLILSHGCVKSLLDQSELARNQGPRLVVPILNSIDPIDDAEAEFQGAQDVRPDDLKAIATDYVIGRNDLITVSVTDLVGGGIETVRTARVSETGRLSLPQLNEPIEAAGMTELQLQRAIAAEYKRAGILQEAKVSVTVVEARQRTFNILGAVSRPGQYAILESDFRILNALVQAGDVTANVEYLYIIRKLASEKIAAPTTEPAANQPDVTPPDVTPKAPVDLAPPDVKKPSDLGPRGELSNNNGPLLAANQDSGKPSASGAAANPDERIGIIDGKPIPVSTTQPARNAANNTVTAVAPPSDDVQPRIPTTQPSAGMGTDATANMQPGYQFGTLRPAEDQRVIRVPLEQLRKADLRYNIVIRPYDTIIIPIPNVGFYYMGSHVAGVGAYNLTGQKLTLKQAIWSARGLDPFAIPSKTDIIRRIGNNELFVRVDLERIFEGEQPDFFLKPNDVIQVGTDWYPPFLVALRGAFRFTYGFGFLYDRNYAPQQKIPGQ
jgi:polysaccharide export outer membrane protein